MAIEIVIRTQAEMFRDPDAPPQAFHSQCASTVVDAMRLVNLAIDSGEPVILIGAYPRTGLFTEIRYPLRPCGPHPDARRILVDHIREVITHMFTW